MTSNVHDRGVSSRLTIQRRSHTIHTRTSYLMQTRRCKLISRVAILLVVAVLSLGVVVAAGPAQIVLLDLAQTEKDARMWTGYGLIGAGILCGLVAGGALAQYGLGSYGLVIGGLIALPGVFYLAIPSQAERELALAGDSEDRAAVALQRLAADGFRSRLISGIVSGAAGVASLLYPYGYLTQYDYVYSFALNLGMAAYDFLVPSKEEEALHRYQSMMAQPATP